MGKAKRLGNYGECVWIWINKKRKWVRDPLAIVLGITCKNGGKCVDANKLGISGKPFDRLIVMCKKGFGAGCDTDTCTYVEQGGAWVPKSNNCAPNCTCTQPTMYKKWAKAMAMANIAIGTTTMVTWCH
jgi:hypothetical protein